MTRDDYGYLKRKRISIKDHNMTELNSHKPEIYRKKKVGFSGWNKIVYQDQNGNKTIKIRKD